MIERVKTNILAVLVALAVVVGIVVGIRFTGNGADDTEARVHQAPGSLVAAQDWDGPPLPPKYETWEILYDTTTGDGTPRSTSGLVVARADWDGPARPVIAWAHGTTGVAEHCAPSASDVPFESMSPLIVEAIDRGWVVVATDYAGLGTAGPHGYLAGPDAAHDVLDSVRAARDIPELDLEDRTVVWGASQGGHAALWTGQMATDYAPEVDLVGVAAIAPAIDLTEIATRARPDPVQRRLLAQLLGSWRATYSDNGFWEALTGSQQIAVKTISAACSGQRVPAGSMRALPGRFITDEVIEAGLGELLEANTPAGPVTAPLLLAQGQSDQLIPEPVQAAWVDERCAEGQQVDYRTYQGRDHNTILLPDSPISTELVEWTAGRLAGEQPTSTCD